MRKVGWIAIAIGCGGPPFSAAVEEADRGGVADVWDAGDAGDTVDAVDAVDAGDGAAGDAGAESGADPVDAADGAEDAGSIRDGSIDAPATDSACATPASWTCSMPSAGSVPIYAPSQVCILDGTNPEEYGTPPECQCSGTYTCACVLAHLDYHCNGVSLPTKCTDGDAGPIVDCN